MGDSLKSSILSFIKLLRALIQGKSKQQMIKEISNIEGPIMCIDWLNAKIEALKE